MLSQTDVLQTILLSILASSSLITDELLTKIGLKLGCKESNVLFNFLRKKIGEKHTHLLLTLFGFLLIVVLLYVHNVLLLSFFALGFNIPVIVNALTLWKYLTIQKACNASIKKPPTC
jgi:hypothetical protein